MQINLSTSYTALSSLLDVAETTRFKVQVISGRVLATESAEEPEQYSSEGYQFGSLEMFTSTASFGTLYVRATSPDTRIEVTVADTGFSEGISPFTGATGSSGGGGGTSETPASIKQKYESNPNTNALTDELKEKIENASEGVTIDQVQQKADHAEAQAILYSDSKRVTGIDHTLDGQELTLKITNSLGDIDDTVINLPGNAALNLPDGAIPADSSGMVPMVEAGQLVDSGLRASDGTLETAPNSVLIGPQRYSAGGISSFIYDHIANKYYRVLRQDAETHNLLTASMSGEFKEHQSTQLFGDEIEFPNVNINKIPLPTQDKDYIYIPAAGEINSFFEIALARPVTSNLIIELDILGDVIMKVDMGIHNSGLIQVISPPLDLDVSAEITITAYQKNGEPVFLGGQDGNVYLRFKYQSFNLVSIQSESGGGVTLQEVEQLADAAEQNAKDYSDTTSLSLNGGVLNGRLSIYSAVNPEIIIGTTSMDRWKMAMHEQGQRFSLSHFDNESDQEIFEAKRDSIDFQVTPKFLDEELATVTFVKEEIAKGGGSGGGVSSVDISYDNDSKELSVQVNDQSDSQLLDFVDAATLAITQETSLEMAKEYTDQAIENLPSGGGSADNAKVGEILMLADRSVADNTMLYCDHSIVKKDDYPELYVAIGDTYQQTETPNDSFCLPLIEDTVSQITQTSVSLNDEISLYDVAYDPLHQQIGAVRTADKYYFLFNNAPQHTALLELSLDGDNVTQKGISVDFTQDFTANCLSVTSGVYLHVISVKGSKLYHSVVDTRLDENEVTQDMVEHDTDFINPVYCAYEFRSDSLIVVDKVSENGYVLKSRSITLNINGNVTLGEGDDLDLFIVPKNLMIIAGEGTFGGIAIATDNATHCFSLSLGFLLLDKTTVFDEVLTAIDNTSTVAIGGLKYAFATDNDCIYLVNRGRDLGNATEFEIKFYKNILDNTATQNMHQPLLTIDQDSFFKAIVAYNEDEPATSKIIVSKSKEIDVSVNTEKTAHYIKAKTDHSTSGTVEKVLATVSNQDLTIDVNDITSTVTLPIPDTTGIDARIDNVDVKIATLESKVFTLETQLTTALETITDLTRASYSGFALYSGADKELEVHMKHVDSSVDDDKQTVLIDGTSPSPDDPDGGGLYTVYHGWSKSDITELLDDEITNTLPEERTLTQHIYGDDYTPPDQSDYQYILDATFAHTRTVSGNLNPDDAAYIYIAFPAQIVSPEITQVFYNSSNATWRSDSIVINSTPYMLFMTDDPNIAPVYSVKLKNGN